MTPYHCEHQRLEVRKDPGGMTRVAWVRAVSGHELFYIPGVGSSNGSIGTTQYLPTVAGRCVECGEEYGWRHEEPEAE